MNDHSRRRIASLAEFAAQAPSVYQLLNALGRQLGRQPLNALGLQRRRRRAARVALGAGWFGAGVAVGSGLAALFTPNTGPELRKRLSSRARRVREYLAPEASEASGNGDGTPLQRGRTHREVPAHREVP